MAENARSVVIRRALEACITGDVGALPELFTENVTGWSPNMLVNSLAELKETVAEREDSLSEVAVQLDALVISGNKGLAEYRLSGVFSGPFVVDDDTVIDPNGREIIVGAALVADFDGDKIAAFRNYFDNITLLNQMLA